ncbi:hypothetical protein Ancab_034411 [Ancistrocladus abbreviatus]
MHSQFYELLFSVTQILELMALDLFFACELAGSEEAEYNVIHLLSVDLMVVSKGGIARAAAIKFKSKLIGFADSSGLEPDMHKKWYGTGRSSSIGVEALDFQGGQFPLKYLGRLQLMKSVLQSSSIYWARVMCLPQGVVQKIEQILKAFFPTVAAARRLRSH